MIKYIEKAKEIMPIFLKDNIDIYLFLNGIKMHQKDYFDVDSGFLFPDINKICKLHDEGVFVCIKNVHNKTKWLSVFGNELSKKMKATVRANAYFSKKGTIGLKPHYDYHDILVYQHIGAKKWYLYNQEYNIGEKPLKYKPQGTPDVSVLRELTLTEGQSLFLPKGLWHEALAEDDSVHFSFGLYY